MEANGHQRDSLGEYFSECLPGEAAERAVSVKHILLSYFGQKSGELFTLYCCIHFSLDLRFLLTTPTGNCFKIAVIF